MNKLFFCSIIISALICVHGCKREKQYTIGLPIENCSLVSYDNHNLTDNGVNIYCPSGSIVVAAMDGVVDSISKVSAGWIIQTTNQSTRLISRYSYIDSIQVSIGDTLKMYDAIGVTPINCSYLHYELLESLDGNLTPYNPTSKFNSFFH